jgi:RNA polymerase sigma-70 factor (ECF subfamily)
LVADHHPLVYRYAYRLSGNQADAEDVAQQTFLTAQQSLHQLRQPENPVPWLLAIPRVSRPLG